MLRIGTGGFTIVPNWALDALADAGSNALALGTLLLRLIPGQTGEIVLAGPTSRRNLCTMLKWGTENSTKFDQALAAIETTGLVSTRIESGNSKIICIHGEVQRTVDTHDLPHDSQERPLKDLAPAKIAPAKNAGPTPAKIAPVAHTSTRTEEIKIKNKLNKITHHRDVEAAIKNNDDEWGNIFSLYGQYFKSIVPKSQKDRFLSNARDSGISPKEIKDRLTTLSEHPLLATEVTSINVVWHFQHLLKKAKNFDFNSREMLQDLSRRHRDQSSFKEAILEILKETPNSHLDPNKFLGHFAEDIEKFVPAEIEAILEVPFQTESLMLDDRNEPKESEITDILPLTQGFLSEDPASEVTEDIVDPIRISGHKMQPNVNQSGALPSQHISDAVYRLPADRHHQPDNKDLGQHPVSIMVTKATLQRLAAPGDVTYLIGTNLMKTRHKMELLGAINDVLQRADLEKSLKDILETLKELTMASNSSLNMLKSMIVRRFVLERVS